MNDQTSNTAVADTTADTATVAAPASQKRRGRPVDPASGLARARALFASAPDTSRKVVVKRFQDELNLSAGTAGQYFSLITRK